MNSGDGLTQIFNTVNIGLAILDRDLKVRHWNRWLEIHSNLSQEAVLGGHIFDYFPQLDSPSFNKNCKVVLSFGSFAFFSQKLHGYLFPFKPDGSFGSKFEFMQQSCTMGPLRDTSGAITSLFLIVQDVTELASYEQKLVEMNVKDALTGVYNRRFLELRLAEECERHGRYAREMSVLMLDIDYFKKVNDNFGHQCGDMVLKAVADKVLASLRKTDIVARYGGEEFCCVLPETGMEQASQVAENIRAVVEQMETVTHDHVLKVTVSLGVSVLKDGDMPDSLLRRADSALYDAKNSGRNKVSFC